MRFSPVFTYIFLQVDVWAAGCILYEMCTLVPPFNSKNIMALVKMIVAGKYAELSDEYSPLLKSTVDKYVLIFLDELDF